MTHKIAFVCKFTDVPRSLRMSKTLVNAGYTVHMIEWDRMGIKPRTEVKNGIIFKRLKLKSPYSFRSLHLFPIWLVYAFIQLIIGNYDMIQPQNLDCMIPAFFSTKLAKRARIIYDLADFYKDAYLIGMPIVGSSAALLERLLIRTSDALILSSERAILQVEEKNLPEKRMMFYNSPDVDFEVNVNEKSLPNKTNRSKLTLFYPGLLNYDRVKPLIKVIKSVENLPVKIVIAGFGEYEDLVRRLSKTNRQLTFLGYLSHKETLELGKRADLMLLTYDPSYINNRIGLPNKLFEAMACGNLILAPRGTYMGEIVVREKIGIVVNYNDPNEIRQVVESLVDRGEKEIQLSRTHAKRLYLEKYNPQAMNREYLRIVENLVSD